MRPVAVMTAAAATAAALLAAPTGAQPAAAPGQLRWDDPVLVTADRGSREMSLVIDPADERRMFACGPSSLRNTIGQSHYFQTGDAGRTWSYVDVETDPDDTRGVPADGGDCDVAYDDAGTMYVADTWVGNVSVGASRDGGRTWRGTALGVTGAIIDRPWIVAPGEPGVVYLTWHGLQTHMPSLMWFAKSTDYGATFSRPVVVTTANETGGFTWHGNFVASPDGQHIYTISTRRLSQAQGFVKPDENQLNVSHDGGATWARSTISVLPHSTAPDTLYPVIAMDGGGHLHAAWTAARTEAGDVPLWYTTSTDRGATWSTPIAVAEGPGWTGWAPWLAGGPKAGQAGAGWLASDSTTPREHGSWWAAYATFDSGRLTAVGRTTADPLYTGTQTIPEFEAARIDRHGRLHLGIAVFGADGTWSLYHQRSR
ncbi:MAG TPA: sialidase family protein [Frankiaceae bacterium]|nr:sialidase family protein [Frankiaceae bacterium]